MANTVKRLGPLTNTGVASDTTGFVKPFTTSTWVVDGSNYKIVVNEAEHEKGVAPIVDVYELDGSYMSVFVSIEVTNAGEVIIRVPQVPDNRFSGKIIIS